jgi:hypothetical protein
MILVVSVVLALFVTMLITLLFAARSIDVPSRNGDDD